MAMKLHQLRAFVAVAEQGSIHGAARSLFLTQPAVTKAIRELEAEVGVVLLARNTRGIIVTEHGLLLLERARLIVNELERAETQMEHLRDGQKGKLAIGVTPLAGMTLLPAAFAAFRSQQPDVDVTFYEHPSAQLVENLRNGHLDFAVAAIMDEPEPSFVRSQVLAEFPTVFAVRNGSSLAKAKSLHELRNAEWMHFDTTLQHAEFVRTLFTREGVEPPRRITLCTSQSLFYGIAATLDVVVSWSTHALMAGLAQQFTALDFIEAPHTLRLHLMQRENAILTRPAERFVQNILETARSIGR
jgi:LysR family transcriptional regulator, regulator of abg operon